MSERKSRMLRSLAGTRTDGDTRKYMVTPKSERGKKLTIDLGVHPDGTKNEHVIKYVTRSLMLAPSARMVCKILKTMSKNAVRDLPKFNVHAFNSERATRPTA